jgi:hypothetical protein
MKYIVQKRASKHFLHLRVSKKTSGQILKRFRGNKVHRAHFPRSTYEIMFGNNVACGKISEVLAALPRSDARCARTTGARDHGKEQHGAERHHLTNKISDGYRERAPIEMEVF